MPSLLGRLWRSGGRRAQVVEDAGAEREDPGRPAGDAGEREEIGRRIEAARQRLRETIPSPEDPD